MAPTSSFDTNAHLAIGQHADTGQYHGLVYRNHPTPSGLPRWLLAVSTVAGFNTEREAGVHLNGQFPDITPLDLDTLKSTDELAGMPELPVGCVITVMRHNPKSRDPVPKEELPKVTVQVQGSVLDTGLTPSQVSLLVRLKRAVFDCGSGQDPELSCEYDHYQMVSGFPR